jgi:hypothetical protein
MKTREISGICKERQRRNGAQRETLLFENPNKNVAITSLLSFPGHCFGNFFGNFPMAAGP